MQRISAIGLIIGVLALACSKSYNGHREGSAGIFTYTVIDTAGVSWTFSDSSYLVNNAPWKLIPYSINESGAGVSVPAGYVDSTVLDYHPGDTSMIFYFGDAHTISQGDTNILRFSIPNFLDTLATDSQSVSLTLNNVLYTNDSVTAVYPYRGAGLSFVGVTAGVTTNITDSVNERLTGNFTILITTPTSNKIKVTGSFTSVPIIY